MATGGVAGGTRGVGGAYGGDNAAGQGLPSTRKTRDNSGSYRCYRVSKLRQIDLDRVRSRGYSFMEEILYWCRTVGCKFGETPILFENRRSGYSKINAREAIKALQIIFELGVSRVFGRTRLS